MRNGINVVVTAPRRYGKSSLLDEAAIQMAPEGSIVRANVLRMRSVEAFASRLVSETYDLTGGTWRRGAQAVAEFVKRLRPQLTVSFDDVGHPSFSVASSSAPRDAEQLIDDVYRILAEMAESGPAVLMLDEFQAVADLSDWLPGLLKALSDEYPKVSLVLAGSRQHLMETLVLSKGAPLYNMAERLALGPVEDTDMRGYLQQRARAGGKSMSTRVASDICNLVGPIPHDIQRLAYEAFDVSPRSITENRVDVAMAQVVAHEAAVYSERFAGLAIGHRRVLEALAKFEVRQPSGAKFVSSVGYANAASVSKAINALEADEMIFRREGILTVSDPFLRDWLRRAP
jgi:AAA+ ATPase superfamily predicted ATPase